MDTLVPGKGLRSQDRAPGSATSRDQAGPQGNSPQEMQKPARERSAERGGCGSRWTLLGSRRRRAEVSRVCNLGRRGPAGVDHSPEGCEANGHGREPEAMSKVCFGFRVGQAWSTELTRILSAVKYQKPNSHSLRHKGIRRLVEYVEDSKL